MRAAMLDGCITFDAIRQRKDGVLLFMEVKMEALPQARGVTMSLRVLR